MSMTKLVLAMTAAAVFGAGSYISDTVPYGETMSISLLSWSIITTVNHLVMWFIGAVLLGHLITGSRKQALLMGGLFGAAAMLFYYALLVAQEGGINGGAVIEAGLLTLLATVGGMMAALAGWYGRSHRVIIWLSIGVLILYILFRTSTIVSSTIDSLQIAVLTILTFAIVIRTIRKEAIDV